MKPSSRNAVRKFCSNPSPPLDPWVRIPILAIFAGCCARAATGHAAAPPSQVMKSRRRITNPPDRAQPTTSSIRMCVVPHSKFGRSTSAWGHERKPHGEHIWCALPPTADIGRADRTSARGQKRSFPKLFDHLIGEGEKRVRYGEAE